VSEETFANMSSNALMTEISTIIEMYEDILARLSLSLNLKSYIFNKLQKNSGTNWDNKKFKDYLQTNYLEINNLTLLILSENRDSIDEIDRIAQKKM
jgi:hypothetical protein